MAPLTELEANMTIETTEAELHFDPAPELMAAPPEMTQVGGRHTLAQLNRHSLIDAPTRSLGALLHQRDPDDPVRIGVIGSGYIARGLVLMLEAFPEFETTAVLTRSDIAARQGFQDRQLLTNSPAELIDNADLVIECSGDPIYGTEILAQVLGAGLPVVTMNTELQVTSGSFLARLGFITEAEGDQPGCIAALKEDVTAMGFTPLVYGNLKGFMNLTPTLEEMQYWADRQGISVPMVTAFTDGTKVQFEQVLVANGLGAELAIPGLLGYAANSVQEGANQLAQRAEEIGKPISDYLLSAPQTGAKLPPGVFITGKHDLVQQDFLRYYKLGEGPYYTIVRDFHLPHLEIIKTVRRVLERGTVLLNNSILPVASVAAVAKHRLSPGMNIQRSIGSFDIRGIAIRIDDEPEHVPLGLLAGATLKRTIEPGETIGFDHVDLPESLALDAWFDTLNLVRNSST